MHPVETEHRRGLEGSRLVLGLLAAAAAAATFALWFQWTQTRRCLAFLGPEAAHCIQQAPRVEVWTLQAGGAPRQLRARSRHEVTRARGLVHLRHGLVEDANYAWGPSSVRRTAADWDVALAFFDDATASEPRAVVAFDLDEGGAITVVGRPGTVGLGRLGRGLRQWLDMTIPDGGSARSAG